MTRLKTLTQREGNIRLSEDDGPPAREFLKDDYDDENAGLPEDNLEDESLAQHNARQMNTSLTGNAGEDAEAHRGFS